MKQWLSSVLNLPGKVNCFSGHIKVVLVVYFYSDQVPSLTTLLEQNLPSWILVNVVEQRMVRCSTLWPCSWRDAKSCRYMAITRQDTKYHHHGCRGLGQCKSFRWSGRRVFTSCIVWPFNGFNHRALSGNLPCLHWHVPDYLSSTFGKIKSAYTMVQIWVFWKLSLRNIFLYTGNWIDGKLKKSCFEY